MPPAEAPRHLRWPRWSAAAVAALAAAIGFTTALAGVGPDPGWSAADLAVLRTLDIRRLAPPPPDPSNAVDGRPEAVALGQRLFADTRFSRDGTVACATCHRPERQFQDGRPVGRGVATGTRRTMPVMAAAHSPWLFWDGRKDSLWSQALGPLEDAAEHGGNRTRYAHLLATHYRADYEALFGPLPDLSGLPADAGPLGSAAERAAWLALPAARREAVDRSFANLGKAIAAYERTLTYGASRFDRYLRALENGERAGAGQLDAEEVAGLRLFIGKGRCATCHNGPLFTDHAFHNTGVPQRDAARPDRGRAAAVAGVQADPFNCLGRHSDAPQGGCQELRFMVTDERALEGAFRTPGLRNVALRAPYMHAGQFTTLQQVVAHYAGSPAATVGHSELHRRGAGHGLVIELDAREQRQLAAFLGTLSGPVLAPGSGGAP